MQSARRENGKALLWALAVSFAALFFCTKSSPAYPINDWADANIYLSIGKGMAQGQVVYRDLYDHKGPLLYALHALCALFAQDFTGVFAMEVLFGAAFLLAARRMCRQAGLSALSWAVPTALMALVYSSFSFAEGDSAEELALPLILMTMCGVTRCLRSGEGRMKARSLVLHGFLAGCVFWIKFTMIGLHAGLLLAVLLRHATRREWKTLLVTAGWLLAGFGLSTLPWVLYFGLNGAIGDWLKTYLYDNLFLYGGGGSVKAMLQSGWSWFNRNLRYAPLILLTLGLSLRRREWSTAAIWLMAELGALATFIGGKSYIYYGLVLAPAALPALIEAAKWLEKRPLPKALPALACLLFAAAAALMTQNPNAGYGVTLFQPMEQTMQGRIAAVIRQTENPTLLNYGFMDAGFFTAAEITPNVKYFHQTNVPLDEMKEEQLRYIEEGVCDYVVTRGTEPECIHEHYELVAVESSPNFWYEKVYLYRRRELINR